MGARRTARKSEGARRLLISFVCSASTVLFFLVLFGGGASGGIHRYAMYLRRHVSWYQWLSCLCVCVSRQMSCMSPPRRRKGPGEEMLDKVRAAGRPITPAMQKMADWMDRQQAEGAGGDPPMLKPGGFGL